MIVGISGKKQAGKNAIGDRLYKEGIAKQMAFADSLKNFCSDAFNIPKEDLWGSDSDKNKKSIIMWGNLQDHVINKHKPQAAEMEDLLTIRQVLQIFGTDICRDSFYNNIWINLTMSRIRAQQEKQNGWRNFVITDVRFPNEAKMIKDIGGVVIRLLRNSGSDDDHSSETSLDNFKFDYVVDNRFMSLDEQYEAVLDIIKKEESKCLI